MKKSETPTEQTPVENTTPTTPASADSNVLLAQALTQLAHAVAQSNSNHTEQIAAITAAITQTGGNAQIADAIDALKANAVPRQKTIDECSVATPYNPGGLRHRELPGKVLQNGTPLSADTLHDEELSLFGQVPAGKFLDGRVTVRIDESAGDRTIHFDMKTAGSDDRNYIIQTVAAAGHMPTLAGILKYCVNEAKSRERAVVEADIARIERAQAASEARKQQ